MKLIASRSEAPHDYTPKAIIQAVEFGAKAFREGKRYPKNRGDNNPYPHVFEGGEYTAGWNWPCSIPWIEFPIRRNGEIYGGGYAGPDRVVFSRPAPGERNIAFCGIMSHARPGVQTFVQCGRAPPLALADAAPPLPLSAQPSPPVCEPK